MKINITEGKPYPEPRFVKPPHTLAEDFVKAYGDTKIEINMDSYHYVIEYERLGNDRLAFNKWEVRNRFGAITSSGRSHLSTIKDFYWEPSILDKIKSFFIL